MQVIDNVNITIKLNRFCCKYCRNESCFDMEIDSDRLLCCLCMSADVLLINPCEPCLIVSNQS
jgi:hypothetical protein